MSAAAHRWRRLLCAVCAPIALASNASAQRADTTTAQVVVECRLGEIATVVIEGRAEHGELLLPLRPLLALVGLDSTSATGERGIGELRALLHAEVTFDSTALVVQIADSGVFPASRRAARARARRRLADERVGSRVPVRAVPAGVVPSAVSVAYRAERDGAGSVAATASALWGVIDLAASDAPDSRIRSNVRWTSMPSRTLGGARLGIAVGDEPGGGSQLLLTNAPVERDDTLRVRTIGAAARAGTELELFEDDVLAGSDSVSGGSLTRLALAQRRGVHTVRLVAYDSAGRERVREWIEYVPEALLPRAEMRYTLSSRACWPLVCAFRSAAVAYAPDDRVTVGARVVRSDVRQPHRVAFESSASLDARLTRASALSLGLSPEGAMSGELRVERGHGESLVLRSGDRRTAGVALPVSASSSSGSRLTTASGLWRIGSRATIDMLAGRTGPTAIAATNGAVATRIGTMRGGVALVGGAVRCADVSGTALLWGVWLPRLLAALRSAALSVRADRQTDGCGETSSGTLALLLPALRWSALELSASWERSRGAARHVVLSLSLRRRLGGVIDADAQFIGGDVARSMRSVVSGELVLDALGRGVSAAGAASDGTTSVHGVVYADDNANGERDVGERAVAGALVRVAEGNAVSDDRGVFVVRGLASDRTVRVSVDSASVEDRGYVAGTELAVLLVSTAIVRVDVPLRPLRAPVS